MRTRPTVSIVIDNYNYAEFLPVAIESALSQTYPHVEVVVVDDGSTDDSRQVIRSFGRDVTAVLKENGGQTSALNAGFARSTGDIVCFLDADDALFPSAAEAAASMLNEPGVARAIWTLQMVDAAGRMAGFLPRAFPPAGADTAEVLRVGDPHAVAAPTSSNAWSRPFLESLLPLPEIEPAVAYGSAMADCLMAMASLAFGQFRTTRDVHGRYTVHDSNDFANRDLHASLAMHMAILPRHFDRLELYARSRGLAVDRDAWNRNTTWFRLARAVDALTAFDAGDGYVAIADDGWGIDVGAPFRSRPYPALRGAWGGVPADGPAAIRAVESARRDGARALGFVWLSFWWLDYFTELDAHLRSSYDVAVETEDLILFDLRHQRPRRAARPIDEAPAVQHRGQPAAVAEETTGPRPLLLLGLHRGGTTYVQRLLNAHHDVVLWGENGGLVSSLRAAFHHAAEVRPIDADEYRTADEMVLSWQPWAAPFDRADLLDAARALVEGLYRCNDVTYWGFKEIRHGSAADIRFLRSLFPAGRLLLLLRHPRDILMSELHASWGPPTGQRDEPAYVDRFLTRYGRAARAFIDAASADPDLVRVVTYESLVAGDALLPLFDWLGLLVGRDDQRRFHLVRQARTGSSYTDVGRSVDESRVARSEDCFRHAVPGFLARLGDERRRTMLEWYPDLGDE